MKKRILVVEDEASIVDLLTLVLSREGYDVFSCQTGRDAISMMKQVQPQLVVLDVMLPGLDGNSIVKIMSQDPVLGAIPVIITSALVESARMFKDFVQVKDCVVKPFVLTEFTAKVKKHIGDTL